jgi:hypothetical protein
LDARLILLHGRYPIAQAVVAAHQLPVGRFPVRILRYQALVLFDCSLQMAPPHMKPGQGLKGIQSPFS